MTSLTVAKASAPASIGNVAVGFDVLGLAFDAVRDTVQIWREGQPGVRLGSVTGLTSSLPPDPAENCALAAAGEVFRCAGARHGARVDIHKGIPLSAGMGGSAASAVAAAGAANALLGSPFTPTELLPMAMEGERVSANPPPWDNVMASLFGGLVLAARLDPPLIRPLPLPSATSCILFHPDRQIETRRARELLSASIALPTAVEHSRNMATFIAGCALDDRELLAAGLRDILIEPQRRPLLPELGPVQAAALEAGAIGCSFSGSGPSVFAWACNRDLAAVEAAMRAAFQTAGCPVSVYDAPLQSAGLRVEPTE
ncbi:homoserine kinase [Maricaulis sp. CAU 1757]